MERRGFLASVAAACVSFVSPRDERRRFRIKRNPPRPFKISRVTMINDQLTVLPRRYVVTDGEGKELSLQLGARELIPTIADGKPIIFVTGEETPNDDGTDPVEFEQDDQESPLS